MEQEKKIAVYFDGERYCRLADGSVGEEMWTESAWAEYESGSLPWSSLED
jgi:hypothetical protein